MFRPRDASCVARWSPRSSPGSGAFGAFYAAALVARRIPVLDRAISSVLRYAAAGLDPAGGDDDAGQRRGRGGLLPRRALRRGRRATGRCSPRPLVYGLATVADPQSGAGARLGADGPAVRAAAPDHRRHPGADDHPRHLVGADAPLPAAAVRRPPVDRLAAVGPPRPARQPCTATASTTFSRPRRERHQLATKHAAATPAPRPDDAIDATRGHGLSPSGAQRIHREARPTDGDRRWQAPAVTADTPGPEVLWSPTPESIAASGLGRFAAWVADRRGLDFGSPPDYDAIWRWSVDHLDQFWADVADLHRRAARRARGPGAHPPGDARRRVVPRRHAQLRRAGAAVRHRGAPRR